MKMKLLRLLDENANYSVKQMAVMLGSTEQEVTDAIAEYEQKGIIRGYRAVIDWDKTDREMVTALIEIKVSPKATLGFDETAEKIMRFDEVQSLFLMSGGFDLAALVVGKSLKDVAVFVSRKLGALDSVLSVSTHFVLKKYKDSGFCTKEQEKDERRHPFS